MTVSFIGLTIDMFNRPQHMHTHHLASPRRLTRLLPQLLLALLMTTAFLMDMPCANAQTYNDAYQQYIKSDYKGAIATLNKVVKSAFAKEELAPAFKLLGIVQYMDGNKKAASAAFRLALRNDPNISISASEVLDESVVEFFIDQKTIMEDEMLMKRMREEERKTPPAAAGASPNAGGKGAGKAAPTTPADDAAFDPGVPSKAKESTPKSKKMSKNPKNAPDKLSASPKGKAASSGGTGFSIAQLLPLGIGQFYNHSYWLGTLIGAAQVGAGVAWFLFDQNINKAIANSDAIQNDPAYTQAEKDTAYNNAATYTKNGRGQQTYCLIAIGGFWAAGALEAVISGRKPTKTSADAYVPPHNTFAIIPLSAMHDAQMTPVPGLAFRWILN